MRILVTGGAGFIGSHAADAFIAAGHEVMVVDDLSSGRQENVPAAARFVLADICSPTAAEAVRSFRPHVLDHHAAQINVRASVSDPVADAQANILGTLNLLEACREAKVRKVLFASSGGAGYGEQDEFPATEGHPLRPVSPYGCAKVSVELYLGFYRAQYGLDYTALRYSNVYGPRQSPHGEAGVVAIFCRRFLSGLPAVINGDGAQTRDYVHVSDVARANVLALEKGSCMGINIATGVEADVNHLFRTLRDAAGSTQAEVHGPPAAGEQRRSVLENRLAFDELGWYPEISLDEGLVSTLDWFRSREKEGSRW